jgi:hypothetical protein
MNNGYSTANYNQKNQSNQTLGIILRPKNTLKHSKGIIKQFKKDRNKQNLLFGRKQFPNSKPRFSN